MIEYEDFSLKIEPKRGDTYPVMVLQSPAGEGRSEFRLPYDPDQIGEVLCELGEAVRGGSSSPLREAVRGGSPSPLREVSPAATVTQPQQVGDELFNAIFSGPVLSLFERSMGMLHGSQRGLRIKIHIDPEDPTLAQVASLPWEYIYRKDTRDFLNLSKFTPIVRYLDVQRPFAPLPLERPLRILVVISDPADYMGLDLERERTLIEKTWARQEGIQVEFMEHASILTLQQQLVRKRYHVLHYMGHGAFDEYNGQGVLVMQNENGLGQLVDGSSLGILLRDVRTLRLVFLNACDTAAVTREQGLDPFAGVASAMVMAGIPAVVAMQFPISDEAAILFSGTFYPLLAQGNPVDVAVAEGRRAIRLGNSRSMEWGTPVLFMRAPNGDIFRVRPKQLAEPHGTQVSGSGRSQKVDQALDRHLGQLYMQGLSAFWQEEWDEAVASFEAITKTQPDYLDVKTKLAEAKQQAMLHNLYRQMQAAEEARDWPTAVSALETLVAEAPDYKDAIARLEAARRQKRLADLYTQAQQLQQAQQWQAVIDVFAQIHALEPDFADPADLLAAAEKQVARLQRQAQLQGLYERAIEEMEAGAWEEALSFLEQLQNAEPGFQETERLLVKVKAQISRREAELQRQAKLSERYAQAQAAEEAGDWPTAISVLETLVAEAPDYKEAAAKLEVARQRQKRVAKPTTLPSDRRKPKKPPTLPADSARARPDKPTSLPS
jgi:outer membrane protein assembly factor BamD (BamD/ComL family)